MEIREHYPLRELTTFKVGGPARYFAVAHNEAHTREACAFARENGLPLLVLGGGSNVLVSDNGFPGLVMLNRIKGNSAVTDGQYVFVTAGAGEDWDSFVRQCAANGWQGLECLSGIPGTVGAAPVQNIGAYGQSVDASISEVRAIEAATGKEVVLGAGECAFGYRKSAFNSGSAGRYIITRVMFRLVRDGIPELTYHDLKKRFPEGSPITPSKVREAVLEVRNGKGLLVLDGYDSFRSAGSFFKNPAVEAGHFEKIRAIIEGENCCANWWWPQRPGDFKVSAACLIQCAGFERGHREGNVGLSPKHTLVLVNYGDSAAREIISFARQVQSKVRDKFGLLLEPEVQLVGFAPAEALPLQKGP